MADTYTYRAVASTETDSESPVTAQLMDALRLNPLAIGEAVTGVPEVSKATALLDTVSIGGSSSVSTAVLDFTNYKFLTLSFDAVVTTSTSMTLRIGGADLVGNADHSDGLYGQVRIDLATGSFVSVLGTAGAVNSSFVGDCGITNSDTGVVISTSASTFDSSGQIKVYGEH